MGNFYVNYTLKGATPQAVATALQGRRAIVAPPAQETVVVFDEESDAQDTDAIATVAATLSERLSCPVLAVLNHDDDILWYELYRNGEKLDDYNSTPTYFSTDPEAEPAPPAGGNAPVLCEIFGGNPAEVEAILRTDPFDGYVFAVERHAALVKALGISDYGVGTSYASFDAGELPDGLSADELIYTE